MGGRSGPEATVLRMGVAALEKAMEQLDHAELKFAQLRKSNMAPVLRRNWELDSAAASVCENVLAHAKGSCKINLGSLRR
jgi:hypothetical protein